MSVSALATLAVSRRQRTPKKDDLGRAVSADIPLTPAGRTSAEAISGSQPTLPDLLAVMVPTPFVGGYTAVVAGMVALDLPHSNSVTALRFGVLAVLVAAVFAYTRFAYVTKSNEVDVTPGTPWLEMSGAAVIALGWGLSSPGSPLEALRLHGVGVAGPLVCGFVALVAAIVVASALKSKS
jgi:hypothetical protein